MNKILLTNIGKHQLKDLDDTVPVVSIRDKYSSQADIPNSKNRRVLHLCFFAADHMSPASEEDFISKDDVMNVISLIKLSADEGKDKIYFQCTEGRIRSYTLAAILPELHSFSEEGISALKDIEVRYSNKDSAIKQGTLDNVTANRIDRFVEEHNKELKETQTHE